MIRTDSLPDMTAYDIVLIGYPNWWNTHTTVINTFIEAKGLLMNSVSDADITAWLSSLK